MKKINLKHQLTSTLFSILLLIESGAALSNNAVTSLPDLGSSAANVLPPKLAVKVGDAFVRQARSRMKFVDDPILLNYLNTLGNKLVKHAVPDTPYEDLKFTFHLIENDTINAFAVPGGQIFIHTGLVINSKNEQELAATLAHEIAHITENHSARGIENAKYDNAIVLASVLLAVVSGDAAAAQVAIAASQGGILQKRLNFTRGFEREADNTAIITLNKAGYDPIALADFLRVLDRRQNLAGPNPPAFLLTHPLTTERIAQTELRAKSYPAHIQPFESRQRFNDFKAVLAVDFHEKTNQIANYYRLNRSALSSPSDHFKYGLALTALDRFDDAQKQLSLALKASPRNLSYLIAMSELDVARKNYFAAAKRYETIRENDIESYNKIALYHAYTLITAKANELAIPILKEVIAKNPNDPDARILISRAYGELNLLFESYKARAQHHYLRGNLGFSIKQLNNALAKAPNDFEKKQLRALKAQYIEEKRETEEILKKF